MDTRSEPTPDSLRTWLRDVSEDDLRDRFGAPALVRTEAEVRRLRLALPPSIRPFLTDAQDGFVDCYALDLDHPPRVVVFAEHAVVRDWSDFESFIAWIEEQPRQFRR